MRVLVAIGGLLVATGLAWAADMPLKAPPMAPVAAPTTWTSCYVGGNVGGGWTSASLFDPTFLLNDGNNNGTGVVGGGQVGCDYQVNSFVFGIEGLLDWTSIRGNGHPTQLPTSLGSSRINIPWLTDLTGRIGFAAMPKTLIYAKGGGAWVRDNALASLFSSLVCPCATSNYTASGWTVGGGVEYMFMPHLSAFFEYDYLGFGTKTTTFTGNLGPINITQNVQMAIVGTNYRF